MTVECTLHAREHAAANARAHRDVSDFCCRSVVRFGRRTVSVSKIIERSWFSKRPFFYRASRAHEIFRVHTKKKTKSRRYRALLGPRNIFEKRKETLSPVEHRFQDENRKCITGVQFIERPKPYIGTGKSGVTKAHGYCSPKTFFSNPNPDELI